MRIMHLKGVSFVVMTLTLTVILAFIVSLALTHSRAKGQASSTTEERMTGYRTPTGPEMTPEAATNLVVNRWAHEDGGMTGALAVTTVHTVFAQAMAVSHGEAANEATYGGPADIVEWRTSPVYMVTMTATSGGTFRPNVSVPRRQSEPSGTVITVIVDAHTGVKEGLSLTSTRPANLGELGPAVQTVVPAESPVAMASHSVPLGNTGVVIGRAYSDGHAVAGWQVVVGHKLPHHVMITEKTYDGGDFGFSLTAGSYEIALKRPNGRICGKQALHIERHVESKVKLSC
ncbi:MAG TPA: hypothetical protein VN845_01280 [Solirubrobacteraceae bacterium]|nr:hypothetical protein [Solirubrobacteraceae bacterium]